jgi:hypothetical protein
MPWLNEDPAILSDSAFAVIRDGRELGKVTKT